MAGKQKRPFSISARLKSFRDAGSGLVVLVSEEPNARIHVFIAAIAVVLGALLGIGAEEWRWIIFLIGWVWSAEAINTAIERLCDVVTLERHPGIRVAKDVAAGAVLISAISAVIIGGTLFWPFVFGR